LNLDESEKAKQAIIQEMISTERDYVQDLDLVVSLYITPLRVKNILSDLYIGIIFSNWELLANVNQQLLRDLERGMRQSHITQNVGKIFLVMADYLKMYKVYCASHTNSVTTLEQLISSYPKFKAFVQDVEADPRSRGLTLNSFLIKPVQRICKYPLLLRELLKITNQNHSDYTSLVNAIDKIDTVVDVINEGKRMFEAQHKVLYVQENVDGISSLLLPSRFLVREGILSITQSDVPTTQYYAFLFNDLLVLTKKRKDKIFSSSFSKSFKLQDQIGLEGARIIPIDDGKKQYVWQIATPKKTFTLSCPKNEEGHLWFECMCNILNDPYAILKRKPF